MNRYALAAWLRATADRIERRSNAYLWGTFALGWVAWFGVWPLADPGHRADSILSVFDLLLHAAAVTALAIRHTRNRRNP